MSLFCNCSYPSLSGPTHSHAATPPSAAGGVIGGLVAAALVAVGVWYVVKKRRTVGAAGMAISNPAYEQGKSGGEWAAGQVVAGKVIRWRLQLRLQLSLADAGYCCGQNLRCSLQHSQPSAVWL